MADYSIEGEADLDVSDFFKSATTVISLLDVMDSKVNKLSRDIDKLSRKEINIDLEINAMEELLKTEAALAELDGRKVEVDLDVDGLDRFRTEVFDEISDGADKARGSIGTGGVGGGGLIASIALLSTTLAPTAVVAAGWAGAMVSSFSVASASVYAFGAIAAPTFKEVTENLKNLTKAQDKVKNAKTAEELTAANKELKAVLKSMPRDIRGVVMEIQNLQTAWKDAGKVIRPDVLRILSSGIQFLRTLLEKTIPVAVNASRGIEDLVKKINAGIKGESWTRFFDYLTINAQSFITTWGTALGNVVTALANIVVAMDPLTQKFNGGMLEMSERFLAWSQTLEDNVGFQQFIREVIENTPKVWDAIKGIATVGWELAQILYRIGEAILPVIGPAFEMARAFLEAHPEIAKVLAFVGALLIVLGPLGSLLGTVGTIIGAIGLGPFAILVGIVAAAFALWSTNNEKLTDTMRLLREIWDKLKASAEGLWENLQPLIKIFQQDIAPHFIAGFNSLLEAVDSLIPAIKPVATFLAVGFVANLHAVGIAFRVLAQIIEVAAAIIGGIIRALGAVFQWLYDLLIGHSILPELEAGFKRYLLGWIGPVKAGWNAFKSFAAGIWNAIKSTASNAANTAANLVKSAFGRMPGAVRGAISTVMGIVRGLPGQIRGALGSLGGLLVSAGRSVMSGLARGIRNGISEVRGILNSVTGLIPDWKGPPTTDYKLLQDNGKLVMSGFIDKIDSMRGNLRSTLMQVTRDISTYGKSSLSASIGGASNSGTTAPSGQSIGIYVAPGAIQVNGGSSAVADEVLARLSRIAKFGQFQGPAKAGV